MAIETQIMLTLKRESAYHGKTYQFADGFLLANGASKNAERHLIRTKTIRIRYRDTL